MSIMKQKKKKKNPPTPHKVQGFHKIRMVQKYLYLMKYILNSNTKFNSLFWNISINMIRNNVNSKLLSKISKYFKIVIK